MSLLILSGTLIFFQGKTLATPPAQQLEEVQAGVEDFVVFKHHFVKRFDGKVSVGIGIFQCGHGCVKSVCLMAERRIVHGDNPVGVLETKHTQQEVQPTGTKNL